MEECSKLFEMMEMKRIGAELEERYGDQGMQDKLMESVKLVQERVPQVTKDSGIDIEQSIADFHTISKKELAASDDYDKLKHDWTLDNGEKCAAATAEVLEISQNDAKILLSWAMG